MTNVTVGSMPFESTADTGALTQVATDIGLTAGQAVWKASPVKETEPSARPVSVKLVLAPGMTSNGLPTVRLPAAVTRTQVTSAGAWVRRRWLGRRRLR